MHLLCHYNLKVFLKYRDRLAPHCHRKLLLNWQCHLIFIKIAPVDLCPCTGFYVLNKEFTSMYSEHNQATFGVGGAVTPPAHVGRLFHAERGQWLTACDIICAVKIHMLCMRENLLPSPTDIAPIKRKKKILPESHILLLLRKKLSSIIILWCYCLICG